MSVEKISLQDWPISLDVASKMFDELFVKAENQDTIRDLFAWIPWSVRKQQIKSVMDSSQEWRNDLKSSIV